VTTACAAISEEDATGNAIHMAYEMWDAIVWDLDDAGIEPVISVEAVTPIAAAVRQHPVVVVKWLTDHKRYSPWLDLIALGRAARFDWDVIDNLTRAEWRVFINTLHRYSFDGRFRKGTNWSKGSGWQRGKVEAALAEAAL
jgi:hypothetical protein